MRVLFLALEATRRRTVVAESADVVAGGGGAVVLIEWPSLWQTVTFAPGVEVLDVHGAQRYRALRALVDVVLFRAPGFVLDHLSRGPIEAPVRRLARGYRNRLAQPTLDRVILPACRWLWRRSRARVLQRLFDGPPVDVIVISDPMSMPGALAIMTRYGHDQGPRLTYRLDPTSAPNG